jgi:8-oxo-dGTP pyrophosphatase MutT (NUDIX family)
VQIGEEIEDGLKREVREETGITIDEATYVFQKKNDYFFYSNWSEGSISLSDEHTSFIFASEEQLDDLSELTTYYRKVIKKCYKVYKGEK